MNNWLESVKLRKHSSMFCLHLHCKKEIFISLTIWFLLSNFGIYLINSSEVRAYLLRQQYTSHAIHTATLHSKDKNNQANFVRVASKQFLTFYVHHVSLVVTAQNILTTNIFSNFFIMICTRLDSLQTQYVLNQRAPPIV